MTGLLRSRLATGTRRDERPRRHVERRVDLGEARAVVALAEVADLEGHRREEAVGAPDAAGQVLLEEARGRVGLCGHDADCTPNGLSSVYAPISGQVRRFAARRPSWLTRTPPPPKAGTDDGRHDPLEHPPHRLGTADGAPPLLAGAVVALAAGGEARDRQVADGHPEARRRVRPRRRRPPRPRTRRRLRRRPGHLLRPGVRVGQQDALGRAMFVNTFQGDQGVLVAGALRLRGGTITLAGALVNGAGSLAVTGGTGAYAGARGGFSAEHVRRSPSSARTAPRATARRSRSRADGARALGPGVTPSA